MKKNKGFTLAEMLIVVAIIGILIAIITVSISSSLEKSREAADLANIRSAMEEVMSAGILEDINVGKNITYKKTSTGNYYQKLVYSTQKEINWQSYKTSKGKASTTVTVGSLTVKANTSSKVPTYWYIRYFVSGDKKDTMTIGLKYVAN